MGPTPHLGCCGTPAAAAARCRRLLLLPLPRRCAKVKLGSAGAKHRRSGLRCCSRRFAAKAPEWNRRAAGGASGCCRRCRGGWLAKQTGRLDGRAKRHCARRRNAAAAGAAKNPLRRLLRGEGRRLLLLLGEGREPRRRRGLRGAESAKPAWLRCPKGPRHLLWLLLLLLLGRGLCWLWLPAERKQPGRRLLLLMLLLLLGRRRRLPKGAAAKGRGRCRLRRWLRKAPEAACCLGSRRLRRPKAPTKQWLLRGRGRRLGRAEAAKAPGPARCRRGGAAAKGGGLRPKARRLLGRCCSSREGDGLWLTDRAPQTKPPLPACPARSAARPARSAAGPQAAPLRALASPAYLAAQSLQKAASGRAAGRAGTPGWEWAGANSL